MSKFCGTHRAPRRSRPIVDADRALDVVQLAMTSPPRSEVVVLVLDGDHRGRTVVIVDDVDDDDAVVEVIEQLAVPLREGPDECAALVIASIRPGQGLVAADADRWLQASDVAEDLGLELLEWFVVRTEGRGFVACCPRDLLAEPPRWRRP